VLTAPMLLVPLSIDVVLLPRVAAASSHVERSQLLRQALVASSAVAFVAAAAYALAGQLVVDLAFPSSYADATDMLPFLAAAVGLLGIYSVMSEWWMGIGRPLPAAISLAMGATVAVAAHLVFTPRFGGIGAAVSIALGTATALLLLGRLTVRAQRVLVT
jgi:O-antigen/teichoic acid export membrane protein